MNRPILFNIPDGKSESEVLDDRLLDLLNNSFNGIKQAFGETAILFRIDIGRLWETASDNRLVITGQFFDSNDGEIFDFEINQESNKLQYKSSSDFLDSAKCAEFLGLANVSLASQGKSEMNGAILRPYDLLIQALGDEDSEAYQSAFAFKLRQDIEYLGALQMAMYTGNVTIEAQPLYAGLHVYAVQYALRGLKMFTSKIHSDYGGEVAKSAEYWVAEHGLAYSKDAIRDYSSKRCSELEELLDQGKTETNAFLAGLIEKAIDMACGTTKHFIESVGKAEDYQFGDIKLALEHSIEEYCPIDNSEGYHVSESPMQLNEIWNQLINEAKCDEILDLSNLGLPGPGNANSHVEEPDIRSSRVRRNDKNGNTQDPLLQETDDTKDSRKNCIPRAVRKPGRNIYYVNVGEGDHRNWDDCRKFGFLAAGCGRKWSMQLEKIQAGDTVIAYLKGYGYVGIGQVSSTVVPASEFSVNGVPIKELPLINDTIRFSSDSNNENGEYLIGIDWQVAVSREKAAWKPKSGLFTSALVCASLKSQQATIDFVYSELVNSHNNVTRSANLSFDKIVDWSTYESENDFKTEVEHWQNAESVKAWYGEQVAGLAGDEYAMRNASFVQLYLNQFCQDHPHRSILTDWMQKYCTESYTELRLDGPALETYQALCLMICGEKKIKAASEEYVKLYKAAAECAVGCLIEINDTIRENAIGEGKDKLANLFTYFRDGWDNFYDIAFDSPKADIAHIVSNNSDSPAELANLSSHANGQDANSSEFNRSRFAAINDDDTLSESEKVNAYVEELVEMFDIRYPEKEATRNQAPIIPAHKHEDFSRFSSTPKATSIVQPRDIHIRWHKHSIALGLLAFIFVIGLASGTTALVLLLLIGAPIALASYYRDIGAQRNESLGIYQPQKEHAEPPVPNPEDAMMSFLKDIETNISLREKTREAKTPNDLLDIAKVAGYPISLDLPYAKRVWMKKEVERIRREHACKEYQNEQAEKPGLKASSEDFDAAFVEFTSFLFENLKENRALVNELRALATFEALARIWKLGYLQVLTTPEDLTKFYLEFEIHELLSQALEAFSSGSDSSSLT